MIELLTEIQEKLVAILAGQEFSNPAGGVSVPDVKIGDLNPKRSGSQNDEDFPFVVIRPMGGSKDPREGRCTVQIIGGIWTASDVLDGFTSIDRMTELLLTITENRGFPPYRLSLPVPWQLGDKEGEQPHPYYFVAISLSFVRTDFC